MFLAMRSRVAYAVVDERYDDLGMDALVSVCSRNWT